MVGPKVAAAAAQRALEVLAEEDPAVAAEAAALGAPSPGEGQADQDRSAAPGQHSLSGHAQACLLSCTEAHCIGGCRKVSHCGLHCQTHLKAGSVQRHQYAQN